jgi:hypothetical protein
MHVSNNPLLSRETDQAMAAGFGTERCQGPKTSDGRDINLVKEIT